MNMTRIQAMQNGLAINKEVHYCSVDYVDLNASHIHPEEVTDILLAHPQHKYMKVYAWDNTTPPSVRCQIYNLLGIQLIDGEMKFIVSNGAAVFKLSNIAHLLPNDCALPGHNPQCITSKEMLEGCRVLTEAEIKLIPENHVCLALYYPKMSIGKVDWLPAFNYHNRNAFTLITYMTEEELKEKLTPPKPSYRPYNVELDANILSELVGRKVTEDIDGSKYPKVYLITSTSVSHGTISIQLSNIKTMVTAETLLKDFSFAEGGPCGVKVV